MKSERITVKEIKKDLKILVRDYSGLIEKIKENKANEKEKGKKKKIKNIKKNLIKIKKK